MSSTYNIAIDGPAGAGKSTIAKLVAAKLGFIYVDTGAMYRAMALYFLENGIQPEDEEKVSAACGQIDISLRYQDGVQQVILNGRDVSGKIRTEAVGNAASVVSAYRAVRQALLALQQNLAKTSNVIMDGRDIGTVVFPDAELKLFVTASPEVRAKRRVDELEAKGIPASYEEVLENVKKRDYIDSTREESPLRQADDALVLDNSHMTLEEQKAWLLEQYHKAIGS